MGLTLSDFYSPYEHEMNERIEQLERDNAILRVLLREAAPKCEYRMCKKISTWRVDEERSGERYLYCDEHCHYEYESEAEPYDLGRRIKAALKGNEQ